MVGFFGPKRGNMATVIFVPAFGGFIIALVILNWSE